MQPIEAFKADLDFISCTEEKLRTLVCFLEHDDFFKVPNSTV